MKPEKIKRLRGMLCRMIDGRVFLRVRSPNGRYRDYDIAHCDLEIEVLDDDAFVYRRNRKLVIDYGQATLGTEGGGAGQGESECRTRCRRSPQRTAQPKRHRSARGRKDDRRTK